jgi:Fungal Zn(2)-Cys(6) binuclear cluster domain/Fungal specific transcription factor domain
MQDRRWGHPDDIANGTGSDNPTGPSKRTASSSTQAAPRKRTRTNIACNVCRSRRTKCDSQRPSCSYCRSHSIDCHYQETQDAPHTRLEAELAVIHSRLDHLTNLIAFTTVGGFPQDYASSSNHVITQDPGISDTRVTAQDSGNTRPADDDGDDDEEGAPFRLLGTHVMMRVLDLEEGFADEILRLERSGMSVWEGGSRLCIVQQQQALSALAAFSEHVHCWYPIFRPGFSETYIHILSGPLPASSDTCLALLVAAIGCFAHNKATAHTPASAARHDTPYFEAAMSSLPAVLSDTSVTSIQCLVLLAIYYCCLLKPCQAHDYALIASFKAQNLLKSFRRTIDSNHEMYEHVKRAYWSILLLESELAVQFDVAKSGIWELDEEMALPDHRRTWQFDIDVGSPVTASATSPASTLSTNATINPDKVQAYFLAEISMRRMLHRCNTAVRRSPATGKLVYAPSIAMELEAQLEEWHSYLPELIRFTPTTTDGGADAQNSSLTTPQWVQQSPQLSTSMLSPSGNATTSFCPLTNFLRVQYHCCKISIYWPAVYQAMQEAGHSRQSSGGSPQLPLLLDHCARLFYSYIQLIPAIVEAYRTCLVNRWTLYATIFMTSMAVLKARKTATMEDGGGGHQHNQEGSGGSKLRRLACSVPVDKCLRMAAEVDAGDESDGGRGSASSKILRDTLRRRMDEDLAGYSTSDGSDHLT